MESLKKNKILTSVFAVTFLAFIYFMFFNGGGSGSTTGTGTGAPFVPGANTGTGIGTGMSRGIGVGTESETGPINNAGAPNMLGGVLPEQTVGREILNMLARMNTVKIDNSLFAESVWTSLRDFAVTLPSNIPGKSNIFSPIGQ